MRGALFVWLDPPCDVLFPPDELFRGLTIGWFKFSAGRLLRVVEYPLREAEAGGVYDRDGCDSRDGGVNGRNPSRAAGVLPPAEGEVWPGRLVGGVNVRCEELFLPPDVPAFADGVLSPAPFVLAAGGVNVRHPGRAFDCELPAGFDRFVPVALEDCAAFELLPRFAAVGP